MKLFKNLSLIVLAISLVACTATESDKNSEKKNIQQAEENNKPCDDSGNPNPLSYQSIPAPLIGAGRNTTDTLISVFNDLGTNGNNNNVRIELTLPAGAQILRVEETEILRGENCINCDNDHLVFNFIYNKNPDVTQDSMIIINKVLTLQEHSDFEYIVVRLNGKKKKVVTMNANVQPFFGKSNCQCED